MDYPKIANIKEHPLIDWWDLPKQEQQDFDWPGAEECVYFQHGSYYYCLGEFMAAQVPESERKFYDANGNIVNFAYEGVFSLNAFHGCVIILSEDAESVIAADVYS